MPRLAAALAGRLRGWLTLHRVAVGGLLVAFGLAVAGRHQEALAAALAALGLTHAALTDPTKPQ